MSSSQFDLSGKKVLVTGGTGFIGGRLIEKLIMECHADVRVLVRNLTRAVRAARFPLQIIQGDITNLSDVERAVSGCQIVFHCAYGNDGSPENQRKVNVEGTRNVLEAAVRAGVKRLVHLSTLLVYGDTPDGDLDEAAPKQYFGHIYADSKLDAENLVFEYASQKGLPVTVLQPTAVYGPFAKTWTINVIERLKKERVILVNGGDGFCNAVYIDDVIQAILLAAVKEQAVGEAFLISGEQPVTWREFFTRFERMLGISSNVSMSVAETKTFSKKRKAEQRWNKSMFGVFSQLSRDPMVRVCIKRSSEIVALKRCAKFLLPNSVYELGKKWSSNNGGTNKLRPDSVPEKPIHPLMQAAALRLYESKIRVKIDKARRLLDYKPAYDFETGMHLTEKWAKWANLLEPAHPLQEDRK